MFSEGERKQRRRGRNIWTRSQELLFHSIKTTLKYALPQHLALHVQAMRARHSLHVTILWCHDERAFITPQLGFSWRSLCILKCGVTDTTASTRSGLGFFWLTWSVPFLLISNLTSRFFKNRRRVYRQPRSSGERKSENLCKFSTLRRHDSLADTSPHTRSTALFQYLQKDQFCPL